MTRSSELPSWCKWAFDYRDYKGLTRLRIELNLISGSIPDRNTQTMVQKEMNTNTKKVYTIGNRGTVFVQLSRSFLERESTIEYSKEVYIEHHFNNR